MRKYGKKKHALIFNDTVKAGVIENALNRLIEEFASESVEVTIATSFDDCYSIFNANTPVDCFMLGLFARLLGLSPAAPLATTSCKVVPQRLLGLTTLC